MNNQNIFNKLQAFSFGRLQDAANVIGILQKNGIEPADFVAAVRQEVENQKARIQEENRIAKQRREEAEKARAEWRKKAPRCPDCGAKLSIRPIRAKQGKQNRFGYRSHWFCQNCAWEQYSKNGIDEEIKQYMGV